MALPLSLANGIGDSLGTHIVARIDHSNLGLVYTSGFPDSLRILTGFPMAAISAPPQALDRLHHLSRYPPPCSVHHTD